MQLLNIIKKLEGFSNTKRFDIITSILEEDGIPYTIQTYASGRNILIEAVDKKTVVGISSHFDVVPGSWGANDNGSAVAVCLHLLQLCKQHTFNNIGISVFIFDEEENHLKGSRAFVAEKGFGNLTGLINLEMVGQGNRFALWPTNTATKGVILETFEAKAANMHIPTGRFDNIVTNYADHGSFLEAGMKQAFSVTGISEGDLMIAAQYYASQAGGASFAELAAIMEQAPLFKHYHKPSDRSEHLNENSLQAASAAVWNTLLALDEADAFGKNR